MPLVSYLVTDSLPSSPRQATYGPIIASITTSASSYPRSGAVSKPEEADPKWMLEHGYLEKVELRAQGQNRVS